MEEEARLNVNRISLVRPQIATGRYYYLQRARRVTPRCRLPSACLDCTSSPNTYRPLSKPPSPAKSEMVKICERIEKNVLYFLCVDS